MRLPKFFRIYILSIVVCVAFFFTFYGVLSSISFSLLFGWFYGYLRKNFASLGGTRWLCIKKEISTQMSLVVYVYIHSLNQLSYAQLPYMAIFLLMIMFAY